MDKKLELYMKEYIWNIEKICVYILKELKIYSKSQLIEYRYDFNKYEFNVGGIHLSFHGLGCIAQGKGFFYDWDFGYGSRWCGINPILLENTMKNNNVNEYTRKEIEEQCEKFVCNGKMYKKYGLYYFVILEHEFIKTTFPQEFDFLEIVHFEEKYVVKRNKNIERFLRKSNKIWKETENYYDKYDLNFMFNNKVVYKSYFCDVGYPDKAVNLMKAILSEAKVQ